ncbi:nuclease-related domain-containing protein [Nitrosopumilus sp.]|uniref:nuclease-related domain-containing protein n=1 Tax=Nitrosopumilus sp. TaxID=2024843 RepID=UPI003D0B1D41
MAIIYGRADSEKQLLDLYPKKVKSIDDIDRVHKELKQEYKTTDDGWFGLKKWNKKKQIKNFEKKKDDSFHAGAKGELSALDVLSQIPDDFHIMCGVNLALPKYVTYNGKRNLKSAQMDFVVVSKRGVVLIEVKNWTAKYYMNNQNISPHEQADRAARVLWISLQSWRAPKKPKVKSVVLSTRINMPYDSKFKFVSVSNLEKINSFLQNRDVEFSDKEVERLVGRLKGHVTK